MLRTHDIALNTNLPLNKFNQFFGLMVTTINSMLRTFWTFLLKCLYSYKTRDRDKIIFPSHQHNYYKQFLQKKLFVGMPFFCIIKKLCTELFYKGNTFHVFFIFFFELYFCMCMITKKILSFYCQLDGSPTNQNA